jgi:hypothetical protein
VAAPVVSRGGFGSNRQPSLPISEHAFENADLIALPLSHSSPTRRPSPAAPAPMTHLYVPSAATSAESLRVSRDAPGAPIPQPIHHRSPAMGPVDAATSSESRGGIADSMVEDLKREVRNAFDRSDHADGGMAAASVVPARRPPSPLPDDPEASQASTIARLVPPRPNVSTSPTRRWWQPTDDSGAAVPVDESLAASSAAGGGAGSSQVDHAAIVSAVLPRRGPSPQASPRDLVPAAPGAPSVADATQPATSEPSEPDAGSRAQPSGVASPYYPAPNVSTTVPGDFSKLQALAPPLRRLPTANANASISQPDTSSGHIAPLETPRDAPDSAVPRVLRRPGSLDSRATTKLPGHARVASASATSIDQQQSIKSAAAVLTTPTPENLSLGGGGGARSSVWTSPLDAGASGGVPGRHTAARRAQRAASVGGDGTAIRRPGSSATSSHGDVALPMSGTVTRSGSTSGTGVAAPSKQPPLAYTGVPYVPSMGAAVDDAEMRTVPVVRRSDRVVMSARAANNTGSRPALAAPIKSP